MFCFTILASLLSCQIDLMHASAPNDINAFCADSVFSPIYYATNIRVLLDSYNYINLLSPHDGAVWQQVDNDTNNPRGVVTKWMQNSNLPCRQIVIACGFGAGPQNNWLITQHIKRNVESLTQVRILIEYVLACDAESCVREFLIWKREAPVLSSTKVRNIRGYQMVARVRDDKQLTQQNTTVNIDLSTDEDGFYLAIVDEGTCLEVNRVIVFYDVCPAGVVSLATTTETMAPHAESTSQPVLVAVECVDGATPENGVSALLNCSQGGVWKSIPGSSCICNFGLVASQNGLRCQGCPIGMYLSLTNQGCCPCPANSAGEVSGLTECPCLEGYHRPPGEVDSACTPKYSAFMQSHANVPITSIVFADILLLELAIAMILW